MSAYSVPAAPPPLLPKARPVSPLLLGGVLSVLAAGAYLGMLADLRVPTIALATVAAVGIAALISGLAGFAFSAICGAIVFQFRHDPVETVQIMLLCSLVNQMLCVWRLGSSIRPRAMRPFLMGGLIGVPAGAFLLLHLAPHDYLIGLGVLLSGYGLTMLVRPPLRIARQRDLWDAMSGFAGGVMGGFAATPGAPVAIWCGTKGWDKMAQRAVVQPYIVVVQIAGLVSIALLHPPGVPHPGVPALAWLCVPLGLLGTWWGFTLGRTITDRQFGRLVNVLLIVSGLGLLA